MSGLSPMNYINKQFGEACQEIAAEPQNVVDMLIFSFMTVTPEERGAKFALMKKEFNKFAASADFKTLTSSINKQINDEELQLLNWLQTQFVSEDE